MFPASQVFLVRKVTGSDAGQLYAMKVLKKATLKGKGLGRGQLLLKHITVVFPWQLEEILTLLRFHGTRNHPQSRVPHQVLDSWLLAHREHFSGTVTVPARFSSFQRRRCVSSILHVFCCGEPCGKRAARRKPFVPTVAPQ